LQLKLSEIEQSRSELQEEVERTKLKAYEMLAQKDTEGKRLRASLQKYHNYLAGNLSAEQIHEIGFVHDQDIS